MQGIRGPTPRTGLVTAGLITVLAALVLGGCGSSAARADRPPATAPPVWCPVDQRAFDARVLVGRAYEPAQRLARRSRCVLRRSKIDGVDQALTMDYRADRVDVEVEDGRISAIDRTG